MGLLVDGVWQDDISRTKDGHFIRPTTKFRNWVTPDGSPGPSGEGDFAAEAGRYHLYVSLACPWAHRTIIFRKLKALENVVSMSIVSPDMIEKIIRPVARVDRLDQQCDVFGCRKVGRACKIIDEYAIGSGPLLGRDLSGKTVNCAAADRARVLEGARKQDLPVFLPTGHRRKPELALPLAGWRVDAENGQVIFADRSLYRSGRHVIRKL